MNEEQVKFQELQLKHMRIQTGILAVMLALFLAIGGFLAVQVGSVMKQVQNIDLEKVNAAIASLEEITAELDDIEMDTINEAVLALKEAAGNLSNADMSAINDGIIALSGAAENLQNLDMEKMNDMIQSLDKVAKQMEATTSAFGKLFGR